MKQPESPLSPPATAQGGSGRSTVGHEPNQVSRTGIFGFLAGIVVGLVLVSVLLAWLFDWLLAREERAQTPPSPLAAERSATPAPRLQVAPHADLEAMRAAEDARLHALEWVSQRDGVVRIPIDRALEIVAREGLPKWPPVEEPKKTPVPEKKP